MKIKTIADYLTLEERHGHLKAFTDSFLKEVEEREAAGTVTAELAAAVHALAAFSEAYWHFTRAESNLDDETLAQIEITGMAIAEAQRIVRHGPQG